MTHQAAGRITKRWCKVANSLSVEDFILSF